MSRWIGGLPGAETVGLAGKGLGSMAEELWRPSLDLALHRNRRSVESRFVQLATVRLDGRPAIRTVVFRGFLDDSCNLVFTTDVRSAKCAEIERSPAAEVCWYFAVTREQFRLSGSIRVVDASTPAASLQDARREAWRELSDETRASFAWPTPGEPRDFQAPRTPISVDAEAPHEHFALMLLSAREVDHLELVGDPQHRWKYAADARGRWSGCEVNP
jgi:PPOX class probable FMN-dependent enzyme